MRSNIKKPSVKSQNHQMLGKRKQTGWQPRNKMRATKARMKIEPHSQDPVIILRQSISEQTPPFAEKKFHELGQDSTTIQNIATTTTPAHSGFSSLNLISYGDSMSTRNGNKVLLDSISKGRCIVDKNSDPSFANVVSTTTIFRIVVFLDTQCNGGSPTMDGIL